VSQKEKNRGGKVGKRKGKEPKMKKLEGAKRLRWKVYIVKTEEKGSRGASGGGEEDMIAGTKRTGKKLKSKKELVHPS